ncbi:MAG TPA: hypothetical protein VF069_12185 [Streptosporangiaceae bacterium]
MRQTPGAPADRIPATLAWLGTFGAALTVAGVHYPGRTLFTLLFLLVTPAVCVAQLLPGLDRLARGVVGVAGGLTLISVVAEVMLAAKWWTPRGGLITVGVLCAAMLGASLIRRPRPRPARGSPPAPPAAGAQRAAPGVDDDAWIYEE